ncbi:toxin-antitoxin system YwqK family antitoxin [Cellulophaga sp. Z1A5H]|uniref:toxin-antitoxin system YwqK family antitoxin n=1 Tax=Cellulophaga sp. Z1A5H TaxID=2687291 RepID=UPI0013FDBB2C|nr:hypothetical protein [Cellulophaga sp. Z1A5H]
MGKIILTIFSVLLFNIAYSQVKETIYFNTNWEQTTKDAAAYYRNLPLEEKDNLVLIKDYYISGAPQMIGWARKEDESILVEEVKWFHENGNLKQIAHYFLNSNIAPDGLQYGDYKVYYENGKIYREEHYFMGGLNGISNYYDDNGEIITSCVYENDRPIEGVTNCFTTYKEGKLIERKLLYEDTNQVAYEEYRDISDKRNNSIVYYNKSGEIVREKKIKFYPSKKCGYVLGIKHIKDIFRSYAKPSDEELFFDKSGEILYKGITKYGSPFNGSFFNTDSRLSEESEDELYYIETYKEGKIKNIKTYLKDSIFTEGNFVNEEPHDGTFQFVTYFNNRQASVVSTLKDGLKEGKESYYEEIKDINKNKTLAYFYYKNGKKDGESSIYSNIDRIFYTMVYKDDEPFEGFIKDKNHTVLHYKNGKIVMQKKWMSYKDYTYYEIYKNDVKTGVEYNFLDDDGQEIAPGVFKNGKPYSGFFFNTDIDTITLEYYRAGIRQPKQAKEFREISYQELRLE